jgi:hypothetical protein
LIGIYFGSFLFLEKEKGSPTRNKSPREQLKRYLRKSLKKTKIEQIKKSPMTILGLKIRVISMLTEVWKKTVERQPR